MGAKVIHYYKVREEVHWIPEETLRWSRKCLYGRLALRCNHKNESWWSNEKLAREMQIEKRTLQKWCRQLESLGLIKIDRSTRRKTNSISITEPTFEEWLKLGVPIEVLKRLRSASLDTQGCPAGHGEGVQLDTPIIKGKVKMKNENGVGEAAAKKMSLDEIWTDPGVLASGDRAIAASEKRGAMPTIETSMGVKVTPETEEDFNMMIARWTPRQWSQAFVKAMDAHGYSVAFAKYQTVDLHVSGIRDHLHRRELSRLKIYRFLLEWFPSVYSSICETEFKKNQDDFMFSVSWMEPRLSRLMDLYKEVSHSKRPSTKKKKRIAY